MKKWIAWVLVLVCIAGITASAAAEWGFEAICGLYCDESAFGEPWAVYDMAEGEDAKICFAIFLFDPDNDMTQVVLIGADAEGVNRYYTWTSGYEGGALMMSFLISRFADLQAMCDEGVDFCVSYSFDSGETMTDIATVEAAEELNAILQQDAEDLETGDAVENP